MTLTHVTDRHMQVKIEMIEDLVLEQVCRRTQGQNGASLPKDTGSEWSKSVEGHRVRMTYLAKNSSSLVSILLWKQGLCVMLRSKER